MANDNEWRSSETPADHDESRGSETGVEVVYRLARQLARDAEDARATSAAGHSAGSDDDDRPDAHTSKDGSRSTGEPHRGPKRTSSVVEPMDAVVAILCRRPPDTPSETTEAGSGDDIEVFLVQRAPGMAFVPGQWSFPGGGVNAADRRATPAFSIIAPSSVPSQDGKEDGRDAIESEQGPFLAALVREVAEETGLSIDLATARIAPAGRLVTPEFAPIRFDARFYLVSVARDARLDVSLSDGELVDGCWISPAEALERWQRCEWVIAAPVLALLEGLASRAEPRGDGGADAIPVDEMAATAARCYRAAEIGDRWPRAYPLLPSIFQAPVRTPTLPPATHTNTYFLGGRDMVVVDPASPYEDEREALDEAIAMLQADRRLVEIWLTHHHVDHVGGVSYLQQAHGVPVAAHPRTAELLAGRVEVDRTLADGEVLELPGDPPCRLRVVYTPGHAPGHICIFEEHSGFLVAGDMIAGVGTIVIEPSEGDMAQYLASLARMRALEPRAILPAHGHAIVTPDAARAKIDEYVTHRLWREERVFNAVVERGKATSGDLVKSAYKDVPVMIHPLAELSLIAHLIKLVGDGRVVRDGDSWSVAVA